VTDFVLTPAAVAAAAGAAWLLDAPLADIHAELETIRTFTRISQGSDMSATIASGHALALTCVGCRELPETNWLFTERAQHQAT
jgi:hypothetical protein